MRLTITARAVSRSMDARPGSTVGFAGVPAAMLLGHDYDYSLTGPLHLDVGGVRATVLGVLPGGIEGRGYRTEDPVRTLRDAVPAARADGADVVIVEKYIRTADNFIILYDASGSMSRPYEDTGMSMIEAAEKALQEKNALLPLPDHPFETDLVLPVRSRKTIYVRFDLNDYSIPPGAGPSPRSER